MEQIIRHFLNFGYFCVRAGGYFIKTKFIFFLLLYLFTFQITVIYRFYSQTQGIFESKNTLKYTVIFQTQIYNKNKLFNYLNIKPFQYLFTSFFFLLHNATQQIITPLIKLVFLFYLDEKTR